MEKIFPSGTKQFIGQKKRFQETSLKEKSPGTFFGNYNLDSIIFDKRPVSFSRSLYVIL
jgi:hypothetical protein